MRFQKRVAFITGAAQGIGRATALAFAAEGAAIAAVDRASCEGVLAEIRAAGGTALGFAADVSDPGQVRGVVDAALAELGGIDFLVNNAGIEGVAAPLTEYDVAGFDQVMAVNVRGMFLTMQHVLPGMIARGSGAVVNLSSVAGLRGSANMIGYVTSKHAVLGLTRAAAAEVARHGVRVNAVCPGSVATRMIDSIAEMLSPDDPAAAAENNRAATPTGRYSTPEEVAGMILYLCSDIASNVTGGTYVIDGGRSSGVSSFLR